MVCTAIKKMKSVCLSGSRIFVAVDVFILCIPIWTAFISIYLTSVHSWSILKCWYPIMFVLFPILFIVLIWSRTGENVPLLGTALGHHYHHSENQQQQIRSQHQGSSSVIVISRPTSSNSRFITSTSAQRSYRELKTSIC